MESIFSPLLPEQVRDDARLRARYIGVCRSLLIITISATIALPFYVWLRGGGLQIDEWFAVTGAVFAPLLGIAIISITASLMAGMVITNVIGIAVLTDMAFNTGGLASFAIPWFLSNFTAQAIFGNRKALLAAVALLGVAFAVLGIAGLTGSLPENTTPPTHLPWAYVFSAFSTVAIIAWIAMVSERARTHSKDKLREARDQARQASEAKSAFLSNMSHEIRTPLNAVLGLSHIVLRGELNPEQRTHLEKVEAASRGLLGIINDILDVSKIEAGKMVLEESVFSLSRVLSDIMAMMSSAADEKGLSLECSVTSGVPDRVVGDSLRLGQVLINLIGNALKFTDQGSVEVDIRVEEKCPEGISLRFSVCDTGIGISPEQCAHIFDPFSQADDSTTRQYGGTGLGLDISKKLVDIMGGEIGLESEVGKGSTFYFILPLHLAKEGEVEPHYMPEKLEGVRSLSGCRILLVEDNDVNQLVAGEILKEMGVSFEIAENGLAAVEMIVGEKQAYDAVLMDIQMPVMDGHMATKTIRKHFSSEQLPVIAMTAHTLADERDRCLAEGMNDYVAKPIDPAALLEVLSRWVEVRNEVSQEGPRPKEQAPTPAQTSAPQEPEGEDLPTLDPEEGMARVNGNRMIYTKILGVFKDRTAGDIAAVGALITAQDFAEAKAKVHTIKGASGNISAKALHASAKELEAALIAENIEALPPLLNTVETHVSEALEAIEQFLAEE